jgi:hypothetical protein
MLCPHRRVPEDDRERMEKYTSKQYRFRLRLQLTPLCPLSNDTFWNYTYREFVQCVNVMVYL